MSEVMNETVRNWISPEDMMCDLQRMRATADVTSLLVIFDFTSRQLRIGDAIITQSTRSVDLAAQWWSRAAVYTQAHERAQFLSRPPIALLCERRVVWHYANDDGVILRLPGLFSSLFSSTSFSTFVACRYVHV